MIGSARSNFYGSMLLLCMLTLILALAWPAAVVAQGTDPNSPTVPPGGTIPGPDDPPGNPMPGGNGNGGNGNGGNGGMQPTAVPTAPTAPPQTPMPTPPPGTPDPGGPPATSTATPTATPTPTPDNGGDMNGGMDDGMMGGPHVSELANRIIKHVATPAQLVMAGGGFQFFFIGPDGNTVSGPTIPSFAELAEMHPSGEWVSLLDAVNPLSGKQVYVDYIPNDMTIRVFTYYPDKGMDVDKPYIFNFGSDLNVNVEAW